MREHLYKARRKDNGEWIEGAYGVLGKDTDIESHVIMISTLINCGRDYFYFEDIEVDPKTVCQFIGRTDINNMKVFEGDRLRKEGRWSKRVQGIRVIPDDDVQRVNCVPNMYPGIDEFDFSKWEVFGNIHDKEANK